MAKALPGDDSARRYAQLLDGPLNVLQTPVKANQQTAAGIKVVLGAIVDAAAENHRRPGVKARGRRRFYSPQRRSSYRVSDS